MMWFAGIMRNLGEEYREKEANERSRKRRS